MKKKMKVYFVKMGERLVSLNETYIEGVHEGFIEFDSSQLKTDPRYLKRTFDKIKKKNAQA